MDTLLSLSGALDKLWNQAWEFKPIVSFHDDEIKVICDIELGSKKAFGKGDTTTEAFYNAFDFILRKMGFDSRDELHRMIYGCPYPTALITPKEQPCPK